MKTHATPLWRRWPKSWRNCWRTAGSCLLNTSGYPKPFKNKVRTFCQNPGGFVAQENYDNDLAVVNGHSYKDLKSGNTCLLYTSIVITRGAFIVSTSQIIIVMDIIVLL